MLCLRHIDDCLKTVTVFCSDVRNNQSSPIIALMSVMIVGALWLQGDDES
jgi:hypothetical protein